MVMIISLDIAPTWKSQSIFDDKSTFGQVKAWCLWINIASGNGLVLSATYFSQLW